MLELLDSLTSENLVLICLVLGVIALCLAIGISVEIYTANKKYEETYGKRKETLEDTQGRLNIKESANVKYVEEDAEIEKTKAKIELENLREKLKKEEEEKHRLIEENIALEKAKESQKEQIEILEDTIVDLKPIVDKVNEIEEDENTKEIQIPIARKVEDLEKTKEIEIPVIPAVDYSSDEEDAIISYEELKNAQNFGYTDEEMYNNVDEEDAIISVQELEKLYNESQKIDVSLEDKNEINNTENTTVKVEKENFKNSPNISPVYGYSKTDQDLILEQTANLEKLNEEIRKTNEFLKMLKDLKKNLD